MTDIRIELPVEKVFAYVSDPLNFPHWNSAVRAVRKIGPSYAMERDLPTGRALNELEVVACERPTEFAIRTTSGPTPFLYRYRFSANDGATVVRLEAAVELEGIAERLPALARRLVRRGVDDNFAALKRTLEAGSPASAQAG
jgi:uncharacterized protein YndB with AHSA1/START domain